MVLVWLKMRVFSVFVMMKHSKWPFCGFTAIPDEISPRNELFESFSMNIQICINGDWTNQNLGTWSHKDGYVTRVRGVFFEFTICTNGKAWGWGNHWELPLKHGITLVSPTIGVTWYKHGINQKWSHQLAPAKWIKMTDVPHWIWFPFRQI